MIDVLIVDDQELIRDSLAMIVGSDERFRVVGVAENGRTAVRLARERNPDVILMDIRMPEIDGIECVKIVKEFRASIRIIMLTTFDSDEYIYESLRNGADGFLLKGISRKDLLNGIDIVHKGGASLEPKTASRVFDLFSRMARSRFAVQEPDTIEKLSLNELKIIQLIGRGLSNKEIMSEVHLSEGTVRNTISAILRKLDLRDRTQIAIFAIQSGLMLKNLE